MNNEMLIKVANTIVELSMAVMGRFAVMDDEGITCVEIYRKFADTPPEVQDLIMENLTKANYIKHVEATPEAPDCKYVFCGGEELRKKLLLRELEHALAGLVTEMKARGN